MPERFRAPVTFKLGPVGMLTASTGPVGLFAAGAQATVKNARETRINLMRKAYRDDHEKPEWTMNNARTNSRANVLKPVFGITSDAQTNATRAPKQRLPHVMGVQRPPTPAMAGRPSTNRQANPMPCAAPVRQSHAMASLDLPC
jgi:hypothetical protein